MKKERYLHVSSAFQGNARVPHIRLKGKWLKKAGFNAGDEIRVNVRAGYLSITGLSCQVRNDPPEIGSLEDKIENLKPVSEFSVSQNGIGYQGYTINLKLERQHGYAPLTLNNPVDVYHFLKPLEEESREVMLSVNLDTKNNVLGVYEVSKGGITQASVSPAEIFKSALMLNSSAIILCHNHPSGSLTPSAMDIAITKQVCELAHLMKIPIQDHVIIGYQSYFSMRAHGYLG